MSEWKEHKREEPNVATGELGPLPVNEFTELFKETDGEKLSLTYARLIDRYNEIHDFEKECIAKGEDAGFIAKVSQDRDRLHKQLEQFALAKFEKGKDDVLADLLSREGNLSEYRLPEYGVITESFIPDEDLGDFDFGGYVNRDLENGSFTRTKSFEEIVRQNQSTHPSLRNPEPFSYTIPLLNEKRDCKRVLQKGEFGILFASRFTIDIMQERVEIYPPSYAERMRRLLALQDYLRDQGIELPLLSTEAGSWHVTTRVEGIVVPTELLDPYIVGVLRNNRDRFGIRTEDMDTGAVRKDMQEFYAFSQRKLYTALSEKRGKEALKYLEQYMVQHFGAIGKRRNG